MARQIPIDEEILQSLWGGYGRLVRVRDGTGATKIVKDIRWPAGRQDDSHERKLRSYQVESEWYAKWSTRVPTECRIPAFGKIESRPDGLRLELEDLDAAGFARRSSRLNRQDLSAGIAWLARFHAHFMGVRPEGLWKEGSYWHLATRVQELESMPHGALRDAARDLDRRLREARFRTLVHGDAKPDNFCLGRPGEIAVVDFQYVGGGCGMRDLAYLLDCVLDAAISDAAIAASLDEYFVIFRRAIAENATYALFADEIEAEWRALFPVAWLDFQRFLQGWSPAYARPSVSLQKRIHLELERLRA
ncbi:MAG: hypothetical protein RL173_924 [Fibrobacterota bacterium]|jgi:hypothetical protein